MSITSSDDPAGDAARNKALRDARAKGDDSPTVDGIGAVRQPGVLSTQAVRWAHLVHEGNAIARNKLAADLLDMAAALREYDRFLSQQRETARTVKSIVGT